jgi:hypothetical protein
MKHADVSRRPDHDRAPSASAQYSWNLGSPYERWLAELGVDSERV